MTALAGRQRYLGEIGVVQWFVRYRLPGAAPSPVRLVQHTAPVVKSPGFVALPGSNDPETIVVNESDNISYDALPPLTEFVHSLNDDNQRPAFAVNPESDVTASSKIEEPDRAELQFRLYQADQIVVVSEFDRNDLMADELSLLKNILNFITPDMQFCNFQQSFSWPVFHLKNTLVNEVAPKDKLLRRWLCSFLSDDISVVLQFGTKQTELITDLANERALLLVSFEHSLGELLAVPRRKQTVWRTLLSARARLNKRLSA